jgi:hypothetical protein
MSNTFVTLKRRGDFFDVFFNHDKEATASGSWAFVDTAFLFYRLEGFKVQIHE